MSVPPLSNRGLAQTLHLWVVPRAEAVVWSVLITRLFGGNTALVAMPYDWREWDRGSPIVTVGGTNFRKKRLPANNAPLGQRCIMVTMVAV